MIAWIRRKLFKIPVFNAWRARVLDTLLEDALYEKEQSYNKQREIVEQNHQDELKQKDKACETKIKMNKRENERIIAEVNRVVDKKMSALRDKENETVLYKEILEDTIRNNVLLEKKYRESNNRLNSAHDHVKQMISLMERTIRTIRLVEETLEETVIPDADIERVDRMNSQALLGVKKDGE